VFVAPRKLTAAVCAVGLGLSVAQAFGSPAHPSAARGAADRSADRPELGVLERPGKRFERSVALARRQAEKAERARKAKGGATLGGGFPSPESVGVSSSTLESIAACESGGDPGAVSADGSYRGKYQFDFGTWASVGGSGDPAAASTDEQDYRAALLYSRGGSSPWPICGS
jgi:Transglycosylase-like domain